MRRFELVILTFAVLALLTSTPTWAQQTYLSEEFGFRVTTPEGWVSRPPSRPTVRLSTGRDLGDRYLAISIGAEPSQWAGLLATQEEVNAWWGGPQAAFHLLRLAQVAEDAADEAALEVFGSNLTTTHPAQAVAQGLDSIGGASARAALIEKSFSIDNVLVHACIWAGQIMTVQNEVIIVAIELRKTEFCSARHVVHPEIASVLRSIEFVQAGS